MFVTGSFVVRSKVFFLLSRTISPPMNTLTRWPGSEPETQAHAIVEAANVPTPHERRHALECKRSSAPKLTDNSAQNGRSSRSSLMELDDLPTELRILFFSSSEYVLSGADQDRTDDLFVANEALSQLSYSPRFNFKLRNNY